MVGHEDTLSDSVDFTKLVQPNTINGNWFKALSHPKASKNETPLAGSSYEPGASKQRTKSSKSLLPRQHPPSARNARSSSCTASPRHYENAISLPLQTQHSSIARSPPQTASTRSPQGAFGGNLAMDSKPLNGPAMTYGNITTSEPSFHLSKAEHGKPRNPAVHPEDSAKWSGDDANPKPGRLPVSFPNDSAVSEAADDANYSDIIQALSLIEGATLMSASSQPSTARSREAGPSACASRGETLYEYGMRTKIAREQWVTLEKTRRAILEAARIKRDCTFAPKVSPYAARIHRPAGLRPDRRIESELLRREQCIAERKRKVIENELQECTFRPLTLGLARLKSGALEADSGVFGSLYRDAKERAYCQEVVAPYVVKQIEQHAMYGNRPAEPLTKDEVKTVVERLCVKSTRPTPEDPAVTHEPVLSSKSNQIIKEKIIKGERCSDVVEELTKNQELARMERELDQEIEEEKQSLLPSTSAKREAQRRKLELEHARSLLSTKFRLLAQYACRLTGVIYRAAAPHLVVNLAKAALDLLTPSETDELIDIFEHCEAEKINEAEFVELVLQTPPPIVASGAAMTRPLLREPPPTTRGVGGKGKRNQAIAGSARGESLASPREGSAQRRRINLHEKPDPAVIARVRAQREARMERWREEARARSEGYDGGELPSSSPKLNPPRRRLIPYECRPDVHVEVRTNRAEQLRRVFLSERARNSSVPFARPSSSSAHPPGRVPSSTSSSGFVKIASQQGPAEEEAQSLPFTRACSSDNLHGAHASSKLLSKDFLRDGFNVQLRGPRSAREAEDQTTRFTKKSLNVAGTPLKNEAQDRTSPRVASREEVGASEEGGRRRCGSRSKHSQRVFYNDMITERLLFGDEKSLKELGRELLMKQLEDYRREHAR